MPLAMQSGSAMKTTSIAPLRVCQKLRRQAEAVLEDGETLSGFVLEALTRSIAYRKTRQAFIARGLASTTRAQQTGRYVSADRVVEKLERKLAQAKQGAAKPR